MLQIALAANLLSHHLLKETYLRKFKCESRKNKFDLLSLFNSRSGSLGIFPHKKAGEKA